MRELVVGIVLVAGERTFVVRQLALVVEDREIGPRELVLRLRELVLMP